MRLIIAITLSALAVIMATAPTAPARAGDPMAAGDLRIAAPWARATAPTAANGAAYLEIRNTGTESDWLVGVESPAAAMAHVHETSMEGGMMKMRPVEGLEIPAGGTVVLKPHGLHIMLMKLQVPLAEGGAIPLTLVFEKAGRVELTVPVVAAGAMAPPVQQMN